MPHSQKSLPYLLAMLVLVGGVLAGCGQAGSREPVALAMAPLHTLHLDVQQAPVPVQEAYQYAVANPEVLKEIPCYCGCGPIGHKNNYDCYVAGLGPDGSVIFDPHALGCQVCIDITQDTMKFMRQGRSVAAALKHVNVTYARYGPSNMP